VSPSRYEEYAYCKNCGWVRAVDKVFCPICGKRLRHNPRRKNYVYHKEVQERTPNTYS